MVAWENAIEKKDRRLYPRRDCSIRTEQNYTIHNLSISGALIESEVPLKSEQEVALHFRVPTERDRIDACGKIVRQKEGQNLFGVTFTKISSRDRRQIRRYLLNRIRKDELAELKRKLLGNEELRKLEGKEDLLGFFQNVALKKQNLLLMQDGTSDAAIECSHLELVGDEIQIHVGGQLKLIHVHIDKPFSVYLDFKYHGYFVNLNLLHISGERLIFKFPTVVYFTDKRREPRQPVSTGFMKLCLPPRDETYESRLLDVSDHGFSFEGKEEGPYFLPGSHLDGLSLHWNGIAKTNLRGEVRNISPLDGRKCRIGVSLGHIERSEATVVQPLEKQESVGKLLSGFYQKAKAGTYLLLKKNKAPLLKRGGDVPVHIEFIQNDRGQHLALILNSTHNLSGEKIRTPVVIIPPPYGRRKESLSAIALTMIHNFRKKGQPLTVIRFDTTNSTGESYKDPEARREGMEYLNFSPWNAIGDILSVASWAEDNKYFRSDHVTLLSLSWIAPMARRAILLDRQNCIKYWLSAMGTPDMQQLVKNCTGGIDYIGNHLKGLKPGVVNFLGELSDVSNFSEDCINISQIAFLDKAREEIAEITIPVTWIYGQYDSWVNPETVRDVMNVKAPASREVLEVPTGHMPLSTEEALSNFRLMTYCLWKQLHGTKLQTENPDPLELIKTHEAEFDRLPKRSLKDNANYWRNYMFGSDKKNLGFEIMGLADEYKRFMRDQIEMLDLRNDDAFADMGCGTGGFFSNYFESIEKGDTQAPRELKIFAADFIPEALDRIKTIWKQHQNVVDNSKWSLECQRLNMELSHFWPFIRFLQGKYPGVRSLKKLIPGLQDSQLERLNAVYSQRLHRILRGKNPSEEDISYLESVLPPEDVDTVLEFNQIATHVEQYLQEDDWEALKFAVAGLNLKRIKVHNQYAVSYPLSSGAFSKILGSLILPYLYNPLEVVREFFRLLKPGGKVVLSSFRPDADMTIAYSNLIKKIEGMKESPIHGTSVIELLEAARNYANSAATLLKYGEEGVFTFYSGDEMLDMLREAGFVNTEFRRAFGDPCQIVIVSGEKGVS